MYTSQSDAKFNVLISELPVTLRAAMEKNRLCNPGTLRTGVSSVSVSALSIVADPATPKPLIPTRMLRRIKKMLRDCRVLPSKIQKGLRD